MNKIGCTFVHGKHGEWVLKNSLDYSNEEINIIIAAAEKAKTYNKRYYEKEREVEKAKAEKRKNRKSLSEYIMEKLFRDTEEA